MNLKPQSPGSFPSLLISRDQLSPRGSFAEAQATYLNPDEEVVTKLNDLLTQKNIGVVAHFYMDPELQGVLTSCQWPHIHISDSLVMADRAIQMAEKGVNTIIVLGVDFMSENVRAMLDASGHKDVDVYRVAEDEIGCSLADAAEAKAYHDWLVKASREERALHVVYINTSLVTKAKAHNTVPTITCTSSNVVNTVLTADSQVDDLHVFFGPDTYMGGNLERMFKTLATLPDAQIKELHAAHDQASIKSLLKRFTFFKQGACVVHHMFGAEVVERVKSDYPDGMISAHLEVPGEMFELGLEGQRNGTGVVGSTSNILGFILKQVKAAIADESQGTLQFILGTEAGMITPIVRQVQDLLKASEVDVSVEIVFPVASEAVAQDDALGVIPGVASGEGCSTAGGCATCPYMKMNSLDALVSICDRVSPEESHNLIPLYPKTYVEKINGRTAADLGSEPILHMREFQTSGQLGSALVDDILHRSKSHTA